jgi:hypothetical protein
MRLLAGEHALHVSAKRRDARGQHEHERDDLEPRGGGQRSVCPGGGRITSYNRMTRSSRVAAHRTILPEDGAGMDMIAGSTSI